MDDRDDLTGDFAEPDLVVSDLPADLEEEEAVDEERLFTLAGLKKQEQGW